MERLTAITAEMEALRKVAETLGHLDPDAAARILRWAVSRFVDDVEPDAFD